ncbi:hypothetical protein SteCoe_20782 [Stentor coeruleus]|uniref:TPR-like protein n=1 Tax=Stentor coeruleus TaxID=5963 RepID=A0A1R2BR68_9CILI|nr:hypothetical protein SteCoe_20782 [Stentor coeruleus]
MSQDIASKESFTNLLNYTDLANKSDFYNKIMRFSPIEHLQSTPTPNQKIKRIISSTPGNRAFSFTPNSRKEIHLTKKPIKRLTKGSLLRTVSPNDRTRIKRSRENSRCYSFENDKNTYLFKTIKCKLDETGSKNYSNIDADCIFSKAKLELSNKNYLSVVEILENVKNSTKNADGIYLRAVGFINLGNYEKALKDFITVQASKKVINPSLFIYLYKCYYHLGNTNEALKALDMCIKLYPKHVTGYFMRGKFLIELKQLDDAINDLKKIKHPEASLLLSKCWKMKENYENALKYLEQYRDMSRSSGKFLLELGKLDYKFQKIDKAMECFNALMKYESKNPEVLYYTSKCKIVLCDFEEAELLLENVAHSSTEELLLTRAIYKLSDIKLQKNDFYGAFHTLQRQKLLLKSPKKELQSSFTEAMYNIARKEFETSIIIFSNLIKENIPKQVLYKCYIYRAFAHFSIKNYEAAENDYKKAKTCDELDKASEFNFIISMAMNLFISKHYEKSLEVLDSVFFSDFSNPMPLYLKMLCQIYENSNEAYEYSSALITFNSMKCKKDSDFYMFLGFFSYFDKNYEKALSAITKSINISEKSSFGAYTLRGFCNIVLKNYVDAIDDFDMALSMNMNFVCLYPYRGLCTYFSGGLSESARDFVKIFEKGDMNAILLSIYLLVVTKNLTEALRLANIVEETSEIWMLKAHCMLLREQYGECVDCLEKIDSIDVENDIGIIKNISKGVVKAYESGSIFNEKYSNWLEGIEKMYSKDYDAAIGLFDFVMKIIKTLQKELLFKSNAIIDQEMFELLYNTALCYMMKCDKTSLQRATDILADIESEMEGINCVDLCLILSIIEFDMGNTEISSMYLQKANKFNSDKCEKYKKNKEIILTPLSTGNQFSNKFSLIEHSTRKNIKFRPAIRLPRLQPPLDFNDTYEIILKMLRAENIDVRPEIPWLVKLNDRYVFTDTLIEDIESRRSEPVLKGRRRRIWKSNQIITSEETVNSSQRL